MSFLAVSGHRPSSTLAAAAVACGVAGVAAMTADAHAALQQYQFTTGANPSGMAGGAIDAFLSTSSVSGTFLYDATAPATGTSGSGASNYSGYDPVTRLPSTAATALSSFMSLAGSVQGLNFSDPRGRTQVGNAIGSPPLDVFTLQAEPTLYTNLAGFTIGSYRLADVRLFWRQGQLGAGDFLDGQSLLAAPPALEGRLALDFVPAGTSPSTVNFNHTVFFDGLQVTAVPEPQAYLLFGAGLGVLVLSAVRRRMTSV